MVIHPSVIPACFQAVRELPNVIPERFGSLYFIKLRMEIKIELDMCSIII